MNDLDQAYQAGRYARERGAPESDGPKYGILPEDAERRKKWREGWRAEDAQRSKKSAK